MKKSKIRKAIFRKLNTAQYENVDIIVDIEEEIEWNTIEERMKKTENITKILVLDFIRTQEQALKELNINKKLAVVTNSSSASKK